MGLGSSTFFGFDSFGGLDEMGVEWVGSGLRLIRRVKSN